VPPTFEYCLDEKAVQKLEKAINEGKLKVQFIRSVDMDSEELSKLKKKYKGD